MKSALGILYHVVKKGTFQNKHLYHVTYLFDYAGLTCSGITCYTLLLEVRVKRLYSAGSTDPADNKEINVVIIGRPNDTRCKEIHPLWNYSMFANLTHPGSLQKTVKIEFYNAWIHVPTWYPDSE